MELWDIYDRNRNRTGRLIERGQPLAEGDFHLVVHIWIRNQKGEFLIQKRAPGVQLFPNYWATTGGSSLAGENSRQAFLREAKEELGLDLSGTPAEVVLTTRRIDRIVDVWFVNLDVEIGSLTLQKEEVSDARFASMEEIIRMTEEGSFWKYIYLDKLSGLIPDGEALCPR